MSKHVWSIAPVLDDKGRMSLKDYLSASHGR